MSEEVSINYHIHTHGFPEKEREAVDHVSYNLRTLEEAAWEVTAAIELFDIISCFKYADNENSKKIGRQFPRIPARVCTLAIYDFYQATQAINLLMNVDCPSLKPLIDSEIKNQAQSKFEADFPDFAKVRNAAAHQAEIHSTPSKRRQNSARSETMANSGLIRSIDGSGPLIGATVVASGNIWGANSSYGFTIDGKYVAVDMIRETSKNIRDVLALWIKATANLERDSAAMPPL